MSTKRLAPTIYGTIILLALMFCGIYKIFHFSGAEIKIYPFDSNEEFFVRLYVDGNYYDKTGITSEISASLGIRDEDLKNCSNEGILIVIEKNSRTISALERDCHFKYLEIRLDKHGKIIENKTKTIE